MGKFYRHHVRFYDFVPNGVKTLAYNESQKKMAVSSLKPELSPKFCLQPCYQRMKARVREHDLECYFMILYYSDYVGSYIEIWNVKENWYLEKTLLPTKLIVSMVWCDDRLFSGGEEGNILEHDIYTGKIKVAVPSHNGNIWCLVFNKAQSLIAAGTDDGAVVLFEVLPDGLSYKSAFPKQEGPIMSIAWYEEQNLIVTGGSYVRVYSASSGQLVQRIKVAKDAEIKAIAVTRNYTIITGDSNTGHTCFWFGQPGRYSHHKDFPSHCGGIHNICLSQDGTSVFVAGGDGLRKFQLMSSESGENWELSGKKMHQTNETLALGSVGDSVISAGHNCEIIINNVVNKKVLRISPIPQTPLVHTTTTGCILLQYPEKLDLWRLGKTPKTSDSKNGEIVPLESEQVYLSEIKISEISPERMIRCSSISPDGAFVAYSDSVSTKLYRISTVNLNSEQPQVSISRIQCPALRKSPDWCLSFSQDSSLLALAKCSGRIEVFDLKETTPSLLTVFSPPAEAGDSSVHLLAISKSNQLAVGRLDGTIHVYDITTKKVVCKTPCRNVLPTAIAFHPTTPNFLLATYTDRMIVEYDVDGQMYTEWSRNFVEKVHPHWMQMRSKIVRVFYNPVNTEEIFVQDEERFCIINKQQPFPGKKVNLFSRSDNNEQNCFHTFSTKYLLHVDVVDSDSMVVVERPPIDITEALPPPIKKPKFGL